MSCSGWTGSPSGCPAARSCRDVSFAIRPGEFTGLIGPNGAGKTTILRVILGLLPPSAGTITVAGQPGGTRRIAGVNR